MQISWQPTPPQYTNGLLQGYKINYEHVGEIVGSESDDLDTKKTTELTIVLTGLKKFTNYSIQVLAYTRMGDGVPSPALFCQTEEDGKQLASFMYIFLILKTKFFLKTIFLF